jgi:tetratricopeptide (TPR) repeat protein
MIGRILRGNIELRRKIGAGGMGNVYEGYQAHLDRVVAVKVMTPEHAANPLAAKYFLREARSASQLRHPNIIQIIDYGKEDDATLYMAMEYVPGQPLSRVIRREFPLGRDRIVGVLDQTLAALGEAHRKQLVHRDLKPDNLMIEQVDERDFVKVLDFGIAQSRAPDREAGPLTQQGAIVGTPQYMSPEQAAGDPVDPRSDLFSLGVILYELLTQKSPFEAANMPETLVAVMKHTPPPPSSERPDVGIDPELEAICLRAIKKNPELRYQTAEEFREAVASVGREEVARPDEAPAAFVFSRGERQDTGEEALAPTRLSWADSAPSDEGLGVDPEELRRDLLGERADVVALVAHQRSNRRVDAEEMADLRVMIDEVVEEVAERRGARLHSRQGSFVTLLFGVPVPKPDDPQRAVQAGLELREALNTITPEGTAFSFALASGEVFCPSSDLSRAAGPPLDDGLEAARSAKDGELTLTGEGLQQRLDPLLVLGDPDGQGDRAVVDVKVDQEVPSGAEGTSTDLVGRDSELATMLSALARLRRAKGSTLALVGEPGVGKTALLDELRRMAEQRDVTVLSARVRWSGVEAVRTVRMQWLTTIVRLHGHTRRDAETALGEHGVATEYARLLGALVNGTVDEVFGSRTGAGNEHRLEVALRFGMKKLVEALADERPVVMVLDDVVGFEGELAELVHRWAAIALELPVLFVPAIRLRAGEAADDLPQGCEELLLGPLAEAPARAFARVRLPGTVEAEQIDRIVRVAGGIPLHLEHLCRHARAHPDLSPDGLEEVLASSRDVGELLRMRLFEQPKASQNVIALLAALGDGTRGEVLLDLASAGWEPEETLQRLHDEGLLEIAEPDAPRLHLRPPALRRIAYDRLSRKMRRRIHARAAKYFERQVRSGESAHEHEDLVALATHHEASGEWKKALDVLRHLWGQGLANYDYDLARPYLEESVRILDEHAPDAVDERTSLQLKLVRCDAAIGRRGEAIDRCRRLRHGGSLSRRLDVEVQLEMAALWLTDEDPELVERITRKALSEVRALRAEDRADVGLFVRALQLSARVQEEQGNLVGAAELALEAVEAVDRGELGTDDSALVWETLNQLGRIRIRMGDFGGARKMLELARRAVERGGDRRGDVAVRANMATLLASEGDLDAAHQNLVAALRVARGLSDPQMLARLEYNRGNLLHRQKQMDEAREAFQTSLSIAEELDWREGIAMNVERLRAHDPDDRTRAFDEY